jgi:hypothetical protein
MAKGGGRWPGGHPGNLAPRRFYERRLVGRGLATDAWLVLAKPLLLPVCTVQWCVCVCDRPHPMPMCALCSVASVCCFACVRERDFRFHRPLYRHGHNFVLQLSSIRIGVLLHGSAQLPSRLVSIRGANGDRSMCFDLSRPYLDSSPE